VLHYDLAEIRAFASTLPVTKASLKTPWPDRHKAKPKPRLSADLKPTGPFAFRDQAEKRKRVARAEERKVLALASIVTPEQEAARQPTVRALVNGQWVDGKGKA
jgi:hypothetical protein